MGTTTTSRVMPLGQCTFRSAVSNWLRHHDLDGSEIWQPLWVQVIMLAEALSCEITVTWSSIHYELYRAYVIYRQERDRYQAEETTRKQAEEAARQHSQAASARF